MDLQAVASIDHTCLPDQMIRIVFGTREAGFSVCRPNKPPTGSPAKEESS